MTRRTLLGGFAATLAACSRPTDDLPAPDESALDFPLVDFHAHPGDDITIDEQIQLGEANGVKLGVLEHAGPENYGSGHMIHNDDQLNAWIAELEQYPVYKGIQAESQEWAGAFSKEALSQLDFCLSDALTLPGPDGKLTKIWQPGVDVGDKQKWMDRYTDFHIEKMAGEPLDIMANVLFLPEVIRAEARTLWAEARTRRIIDAALQYGVAIEINSRYRIPHESFVRTAKDAGVKFSMGSNQHGKLVANLDFCVEMAKTVGLTREHIFTPAPAGSKPVEVRTFG